MKENRINIGDRVHVSFIKGECLTNCEVLYIPCAVGDSWTLKDTMNKIYYVIQFECMEKI